MLVGGLRVVVGEDVAQFAEILFGCETDEDLDTGRDFVLVEDQAHGFGTDGCVELDI